MKLLYSALFLFVTCFHLLARVAAILTKKSAILKRLAYYGLAIDFVLAFMAHLTASDGDWPSPVIAMVLLIVSYVYDRKLFS